MEAFSSLNQRKSFLKVTWALAESPEKTGERNSSFFMREAIGSRKEVVLEKRESSSPLN